MMTEKDFIVQFYVFEIKFNFILTDKGERLTSSDHNLELADKMIWFGNFENNVQHRISYPKSDLDCLLGTTKKMCTFF